jgi:hypothetical protein
LYRLPNTTIPVASGSTFANPWFGISILPLWYAIPGSYEIRLTGHCGTQKCPCVVKFKVDCPDPCPCDLVPFLKAVNKGFSVASSGLTCKACFTPFALNGCDMVTWHIGSAANPPIGMTNGSQTFCHTFPSSGTYTIFMVVTRKKSDGSVCATATKSQTVKVNCIPIDICDNPVFKNPGFNQGAVSGVLGAGGESTNWTSAEGKPQVVEGVPGSLDAWAISLSGNFETTDALTALEPLCLDRDTGTISIRARAESGRERPCDIMVVDFEKGAVLADKRVSVQIPLTAFDSAEWTDIQIPFDLSDYPDVDSCGNPMQGALVQPVVYVTNALTDDQGGVDTRSAIEVDYFCFGGKLFTAVHEPKGAGNIRLFPNPTTGELTLHLTDLSLKNGRLYILDLWGRSVQTEWLPDGKSEFSFSMLALPAGVYFVKVTEDGATSWMRRIVKQ